MTRPRRPLCGRSVRVLGEGGAASGGDPVLDRRGSDLRVATRLDAVAQAGADARGGVRPERSGGSPVGPRVHRSAHQAGVWRSRFRASVRPGARHRGAGRIGRGLRLAPCAAGNRRPLSGGDTDRRGAGLRRRGHAARLGVPFDLSRRADVPLSRQHRLLRRAGVDRPAGLDLRTVRAPPGADHQPAGAAAPPVGIRDDPPARSRSARIHDRSRGRHRQCQGERPRSAPRRGCQRHRPGRQSDPAPGARPSSGPATSFTSWSARSPPTSSTTSSVAGEPDRSARRRDRPGRCPGTGRSSPSGPGTKNTTATPHIRARSLGSRPSSSCASAATNPAASGYSPTVTAR